MNRTQIEAFMREAQLEGRKALPACLPNPPVGCIIVREGKIIARGHTNEPGKDHAEAMALAQLSGDEQELQIFVTLEPCSFQGRTPSCARAISGHAVAAVYVGIIDPHPRNQGAGIAILEAAGIPVEVGILAEEIQTDLAPFLIQNEI